MIDICANLNATAFDGDRDAVIERSFAAGVDRMIVAGATTEDSVLAASIADKHPGRLFSTAGVHPHHAKDCDDQTIPLLRGLAEQSSVMAIGECGLDYNRDFSPRDVQRHWFKRQIELAIELAMPLFVHERDAADDLIEVLDSFGEKLPQLVVHCFTGSGETLQRYLSRDFFIGITGWICDERRGSHLHDLVKQIPANRLMIETDAPYLLPRTIRPRPKSRRNEPGYLTYVRDTVAACRGETPEELTRHTTNTANTLFRLPT